MMSLSKDSGNTSEVMETDRGVALENGRRRNFVRLMVVVVWDDRDDSLEAVLSVSSCCNANFVDCTSTNFSSIAVSSLDEACVGGFPTDDEDDDEGDDDADDDELLSPLLPPRGRRRFIFFSFFSASSSSSFSVLSFSYFDVRPTYWPGRGVRHPVWVQNQTMVPAAVVRASTIGSIGGGR